MGSEDTAIWNVLLIPDSKPLKNISTVILTVEDTNTSLVPRKSDESNSRSSTSSKSGTSGSLSSETTNFEETSNSDGTSNEEEISDEGISLDLSDDLLQMEDPFLNIPEEYFDTLLERTGEEVDSKTSQANRNKKKGKSFYILVVFTLIVKD